MQFKKDPVSGDSLQLSDLIDLKMDRAEDGGGGGSFGWQCPVLCKKFTDYSKVVAIMNKKERVAHVLSYEALLELNYKANNMENLITGEPLSRENNRKEEKRRKRQKRKLHVSPQPPTILWFGFLFGNQAPSTFLDAVFFEE